MCHHVRDRSAKSTNGEWHLAKTEGFFSSTKRLVTCSVVAVLAVLGASIGIVEGASTDTPVLPGASTTITKCTTALSLSAVKSPSKLACAKTTTTTVPPTTTTVPPTTTTTTQPASGGNCTNPIANSGPSSDNPEWTFNYDAYPAPQYWWIDNDAWSGGAGPQTMYVCSPSSWYATSDQTDQGGQVETYPDTEFDVGGRNNPPNYYSTVPLSSYTSITSTFSEAFPTTGDTIDAAYDLWTDNWKNETMIWNEENGDNSYWRNCAEPGTSQNDCGDYVGAATLSGVSYHVLKLSSGEVIFIRDTEVKSGSVDILAAYNWEIAHGLALSTDYPTQLEYGVEIVGTTGSQTFPLTGLTFSLTP